MFPFQTTLALFLLARSALAATGSFNALAYNVAGLPAILSSSDPKENIPYISPRLASYQIVNVQEDFAYNKQLYASAPHVYKTPTTGNVPFGSGLNTLSDYPYIDLERIKWDKCDLNTADCLTPKGFTAMKIKLAEGVWIDVYNVHQDAGGLAGDKRARADNVRQVLEHMQKYSAGMPVILMGDTNMRYTTVDDSMHELVQGGGFTDVWVELKLNGVPPQEGDPAISCPKPFPPEYTEEQRQACEHVDKILYKSSRAVTLTATHYSNEYARFTHPESGEMLSDHYPILADFIYTSHYYLADQYGGPHGSWFSDTAGLPQNSAVSAISFRSGNRLDQISLTYADGTSLSHGGNGGNPSSFSLNSGEQFISVKACQGKKDNKTRIFYIELTTSSGRKTQAGVSTSECTTWNAPNGKALVGFWGRSGSEVDRIAPIWK